MAALHHRQQYQQHQQYQHQHPQHRSSSGRHRDSQETGSDDSTAVVIRGKSSSVARDSWILFPHNHNGDPASRLSAPIRQSAIDSGEASTRTRQHRTTNTHSDPSEPILLNPFVLDVASNPAGESATQAGSSSWTIVQDGDETRLSKSLNESAQFQSVGNTGGVTRPETASEAEGVEQQWSSLPRQAGDGSYFFFDDEDQEPSPDVQKSPALDVTDNIKLQASVYPVETSVQPRSTLAAATSTAGNSDILSLPSSLSAPSVSEASRGLLSQDGGSLLSSPVMGKPGNLPHETDDTPKEGGLTEAALKAIDEKSYSTIEWSDTAVQQEATVFADADEELLSRAPDAISAGIRPVRVSKYQPLPLIAADILAPRAPSLTSSNGNCGIQSTGISSRASNGFKRRHRNAGLSDKGSKRSHTSKQSAEVPVLRKRDDKGKRGASTGRKLLPAQVTVAANAATSLKSAVSSLLEVDDELLAMMSAQPASVLEQARPSGQAEETTWTHSHRSKRGNHRRHDSGSVTSAFSAHVAAELGDSPGIRQMFTSAHNEYYTSDEDTETEEYPKSGTSIRQPSRDRSRALTSDEAHYSRHSATQRHYVRSSLSAWDAAAATMDEATRLELETFLQTHEPEFFERYRNSLREADDLHAASLGLHEPFSLHSLRYLIRKSISS